MTSPDRSPSLGFDVLATGLAVGVGLLLAVGSVSLRAMDPIALTAICVTVGSLVAIALGIYRFEWFLITALAVRPALDDLARDELGMYQPGSVLGLLVLSMGTIWLGVRWRRAQLHRPSMATVLFGVYAGTITVSTLGSLIPMASLTGSIKLWSAAVLFAVLEQMYHDDSSAIWRFLAAAAASVIVPLVTAAAQFTSTGTVDPVSGLVRVDGTFVHPNPFATYLVVCALVAASIALRSNAGRRMVAGGVFMACTLCLLLTYARAGWGALAIGLLFIGSKLDRRLFGVMLIAGALAVVANPSVVSRLAELAEPEDPTLHYENPNSLEWRVGYWVEILPLGYSNPVTGLGLDMVEEVTDVGLPPHNSFVQAFVEAGIIGLSGLVLCVAGFWSLLRWSTSNLDDGIDQALATGGAAAALSVFLQLFTENLITGVIPLWYLAVVLAWLAARQGAAVSPPDPSQSPILQAHRSQS